MGGSSTMSVSSRYTALVGLVFLQTPVPAIYYFEIRLLRSSHVLRVWFRATYVNSWVVFGLLAALADKLSTSYPTVSLLYTLYDLKFDYSSEGID